MFRELSIFSKMMFGCVAALLIVTVALGITTAVKASKGEVGVPSGTPVPSEMAAMSGTPKPTDIAGADVTPEATPMPIKKYVIALDPGQQKVQDRDLEPVGPGAATTVEKMSYGATSVTTKEREYIWTMRMAEMIKAELEARDYEVVLVRDPDDDNANISNSERAQKANEAKADLLIGIQLDGVTNSPDAKGMYVQIPSTKNVYVDPEVVAGAEKLGKLILEKLLDKTGANDRGVKKDDKLALINWAKMPTAIVTLGYASNKDEDKLLQSTEYQQKMTGCICDAIDQYLGIE